MRANRKWIADFTHVWAAEGWLYVAAVIVLFTRRVDGWSMKAEMTAHLVTGALVMAIWRRGMPDALLHHSDQGSQYAGEQFLALTAGNGVLCSMSRSGNVWDNAAPESFFSSLKTERIGKKVYRTRDDARADVFDCIERFCNTVGRHSTIGYLGPVEFERKAGLAQLPVHETGSSSALRFAQPEIKIDWPNSALKNAMHIRLSAIVLLFLATQTAAQTAGSVCEIRWTDAEIPVPSQVRDFINSECYRYKGTSEESMDECIVAESYGYRAVVTMLTDAGIGEKAAERYRGCAAGLGDHGGRFHRRKAECVAGIFRYIWRYEFSVRM